MWVLRMGKNGCLLNLLEKNQRIYICWQGYDKDLNTFHGKEPYVRLAKEQNENTTPTAVTTRSSQLILFKENMEINDLVLIPKEKSRFFALAKIIGKYEYKADNEEYVHSRKAKLVIDSIPCELFSKKTRNSLGAFRTLFHAKNETEIMDVISKTYGKEGMNHHGS